MGKQAPSFHQRRCRERWILSGSDNASPGDERGTQETKFLYTEEEIIENIHVYIAGFMSTAKKLR